MKMISRLTLLASVAAAFALSGCNSGGGTTVVYQPSPGTTPTYPTGGGDPYYNAWYDVYGRSCGTGRPMPGCNFYAGGSKIRDYQDPYYSQKYLQYSYDWTYTDSYGYRQSYSGYAWLSSTGILYDDYGRALNEVGQDESRDLLGEAAELEQAQVETVGKALAEKYALAADKGIEIAQTLNDWAVLGRERDRTAADAATFAKRLYGVSLDSAKNALAEASAGRLEKLVDLNKAVAQHWGTTPETSQAILSSWYASQVVVK